MIKAITLHYDKVSLEIDIEVPKDSPIWQDVVGRSDLFKRFEEHLDKAVLGFLRKEAKE